jgi:hypothetical protein
MICPEYQGNVYIRIPGSPDPWETSQNPFANDREIICPTCEGYGKISDTPAAKHCPACGEPLREGQDWCDDHSAAASFNSCTD